MIKHNQSGAVSSLIIIMTLSVILVFAIIFGVSEYSGKQHYKNDDQQLINTAVSKAVNQQIAIQDAKFAQTEQYPLNTYNGPQEYGSIVLKYPKTWSGYIDTSGDNNSLLSLYFNPGLVPSLANQSAVYALTLQVVNQTYSQTIQAFQQQSGVTTVAYALPKVAKVVGVEVSGPISQNQTNETMVVLPLRTNTLEIATDGTANLAAFNNIILPNLSFSP